MTRCNPRMGEHELVVRLARVRRHEQVRPRRCCSSQPVPLQQTAVIRALARGIAQVGRSYALARFVQHCTRYQLPTQSLQVMDKCKHWALGVVQSNRRLRLGRLCKTTTEQRRTEERGAEMSAPVNFHSRLTEQCTIDIPGRLHTAFSGIGKS
jgi:hypothetical protein